MQWETAPATVRFIDELEAGDAMRLDVATMCIAAHARPGIDIDRAVEGFDRVAEHPGLHRGALDAAGLAAHLFAPGGFTGNTAAYDDPRNSYMDVVLERRLGIPITLAVVMLETGRRVGVPTVGIGMPGHFLTRDGRDPTAFFDPFHGGARLDEAGCRSRYHALAGPDAPWHPALLAPVGPVDIVTRMLTNLQQVAVRRHAVEGVWAARLRLLVPGLPVQDRLASARVLGEFGRHLEAARALDAIAAMLPEAQAGSVSTEADGWRARAN